MTIWEAITWDVARAGGLTAYILLGLSVGEGLALSLHWQSPRWPRIINSELHNFLTLLATIFVGVHVLAVALDPFTHFALTSCCYRWPATFVPSGWPSALSDSTWALPQASAPGSGLG